MTEQILLRHPHTFGKLQNLSCSFVVVFTVASIFTHIGNGRNPHKHIVEPNSILLRTQTGKSTIAQAILLIRYIVGIVLYTLIDKLTQTFVTILEYCSHRLYHRTAHSTCIVKSMRIDNTPYIYINIATFLVYLSKIRCHFSQKFVTLVHIVLICLVASGFVSRQHSRISHTPLVAGKTETALLKICVGIDILHTGYFFSCLFINKHCWSLSINIIQHSVHGLLYAFHSRYAIPYPVLWLHKV